MLYENDTKFDNMFILNGPGHVLDRFLQIHD